MVLMAMMRGEPVKPCERKVVREVSRQDMPFLQTSGSAMVKPPMVMVGGAPMEVKTTSTSFGGWLLETVRQDVTAASSWAFPSRMIRFAGRVWGGKWASSLEGVRRRTMQVCPWASDFLRAARPTPVEAPKKAMVLVEEDMMAVCDSSGAPSGDDNQDLDRRRLGNSDTIPRVNNVERDVDWEIDTRAQGIALYTENYNTLPS